MEEEKERSRDSFRGKDPYSHVPPSPGITTPELDHFLGSDSLPTQFNNEEDLVDPLNYSWLLECLNVSGPGTGDPHNGEETSSRGGVQDDGFGCPRALSTWPPTPIPYQCTCCQVLREIVHTNGIHTMKLEIHGRIGLISHGILQNFYYGSDNRDCQMFDFCQESHVTVENFFKTYFEERRLAGYTLLPDTLSVFYKTVCVGLDGTSDQTRPAFDPLVPSSGHTLENSGKKKQTYHAEPSNHAEWLNGYSQQEAVHQAIQHEAVNSPANPLVLNGHHQGRYSVSSLPVKGNQGESSTATGDLPSIMNGDMGNSAETWMREGTSDATSGSLGIRNQPESSETGANLPVAALSTAPRRRRSYAEQRARAKNLTWGEMSSCFHLRLKDAAKTLDLCETTVKKRLHELIRRWPYRTVNKLKKEIALWKKRLNSTDERDKEIARAEIMRLQQELDDIYSGKGTD